MQFIKSWKTLAQLLFGILAGYCISQAFLWIMSIFGIIGARGVGFSPVGMSFFSILISWILFLIGLVVALTVAFFSNALLIVFVPTSGFISSSISIIMILYFVMKVLIYCFSNSFSF